MTKNWSKTKLNVLLATEFLFMVPLTGIDFQIS